MDFSLTLTLLFGLGLFLLAFEFLALLAEGTARLASFRSRRLERMFADRQPPSTPKVTPDELLGLGRIPWLPLTLLGLLAALGLFLITGQPVILLLAATPPAVRTWLRNQRRKALDADALAFLTDLRLALPLQGSLLRAFQEVARKGQTRLSRISVRYLEGFQGSGLELLERLAEDTQIATLRDLAAWTHAAQEGTLQRDAPFEHALARLRAEMETNARENLQRIPTRLTLFVLPALLGPAIVVLLYPMVARLLASLGGVGWGGGF